MPEGEDTSILRRRLRSELRGARETAMLTQHQVADELDWSLSKLIRIESGAVGVSVTDVRALLVLYQVTDKDRVNALCQMARQSRQRSWIHQYRNVINPVFAAYLGYEAAASTIRSFQPTMVPGLLQIEEYADEVLQYLRGPKNPRRLEDIVALRLERQSKTFQRANPPTMSFIIDEAVIRRLVGGPELMLRQLEHLLAVAEWPNVEIRVVPFGLGFYRSIRVPYIILEFPDPGDHNVLFLEYPDGDEIIREEISDGEEDPTAPPTYLQIFWELERAIDANSSIALIEDAKEAAAAAIASRPRRKTTGELGQAASD